MKRHLVFPQDFDTRAYLLEEENESWEERPKQLHRENKQKLIKELEIEFGSHDFDTKLTNFKEIGVSPFSMVSFHNRFFSEIRRGFVVGSHYPALTGACALGERMLNHMLLILRDEFRNTPEYKRVYRKKSFDDWNLAITTLNAWDILDDTLVTKFTELKELRNKSIHFNHETYASARADGLEAIKILSEIISLRFGFFRNEHSWAIKGTKGAQFIKKEFEADPFIKKFYLPKCPLVGPYYAVKILNEGTLFVDKAFYADTEISNEEFAEIFNNRKLEEVVKSDLPLPDDVDPIGILLRNGSYRLTMKTAPS
tara:strand:- start:351 stop:1286 length:936 start_codon:yes stop_codon:yes gene_type:complete